MSEYNQHVAPAPTKKAAWYKKPVLWTAVGGFVLGSIVAGSTQEAKTVEVAGPERVVTKEVEKIVEVEVTPPACLQAIDLARQALVISSESMGYMNDALQAAVRMNVPGINAANEGVQGNTARMDDLSTPMKTAVGECNAKAK